LILALRLTRKTATGDTLSVPPRPEALRWLIADSWLPHDDEEMVAAACDASRKHERLPPGFRGLV